MHKQTLMTLALSTFVAFAILLSIGISLSARDQAYGIESRVDEIEERLN